MSHPVASSLLVRAATIADIPALVQLNADVQRHHVQAEPAVYHEPDPQAVAAWFQGVLTTHEALIAEREGRPVGYLLFTDVRREANAFTRARRFLLVDQVGASQRRQGVGRALMDAAHAVAAERGIAEVELEVRAVNASALAFYAALGYQPLKLRLQRRSS